jgi:hypothetical protein
LVLAQPISVYADGYSDEEWHPTVRRRRQALDQDPEFFRESFGGIPEHCRVATTQADPTLADELRRGRIIPDIQAGQINPVGAFLLMHSI